MDEHLGIWETIFDVEAIVERGDVDDLISSLTPGVIYTIKNAIADWELEVENRENANKC